LSVFVTCGLHTLEPGQLFCLRGTSVCSTSVSPLGFGDE